MNLHRTAHNLVLSLLLLPATLLSGCSGAQYYARPLEQDYNNTYMFLTKQAIIDERGTPDRIERGADGLETLVYERTPKTSRHKADTAEKEYLEFYLNENSRCSHVKTNYTEKTPLNAKSGPTRKGIIWGAIGTAILVIEATVLILTQ